MTDESNQNESTTGSAGETAPRAGGKVSKKKGRKKTGAAANRASPKGVSNAAGPPVGDLQPAGPAVAAPPASDSGGKGLSILALLLALLALAAAGYAWYQSAVEGRLTGGEQASRIDAVEQRFADVSNSQGGVSTRIDQIRELVAKSESGAAEQLSQIRQQLATSETGVADQISQVKQLVAKTESGLASQISDIRNTVSQQQQQITESVASAEQEVATQIETFRSEFDTLSSSLGEIRNNLGASVDTWSRREVEHLMIIANQRLQLAQDPDSARRALQLADDRLKDMDDPALLKVREAISGELSALSAIEKPDLARAVGTLTLLSRTLDDLPLVGITNVPDAVSDGDDGDDGDSATDATSAGEQITRIGRTFLSDLGSLVQVEKGGEPVAPTITPEVSRMIVARARLMLEGAQVALVRSLPEVYADRLNAAGEWVSDNFQSDSELTRNWLSQLEELKGVSPRVDYPDISGSITALRGVMSGGQGQ